MARHRSVFVLVALLGGALLGSVACQDRARAGFRGRITAAELVEQIRSASAPLILDVRSSREYAAGHVPGAVNIPYTELPRRLGELRIEKSDEVVVYCQGGQRAAVAEQVLTHAGYTDVLHLEGQMQGWQQGGYPTQ